ncbi:DUF6338 family protein [Agromyces sp. GXS1127]|uniref:DUF6338 family protein n=1 Tax=Agromyces sp. GXS1127 TaxID=3424181 RepID=UPI003D3169F1
MGLPEGSLAVAVFVVMALPGIVYAGVRRWARGELAGDRDVGLAIARGVVLSVALSSIYLLVLGDGLISGVGAGSDADTLVITDPRAVAVTVLCLYVLVPLVLSLALNFRFIEWNIREKGRFRLPSSKYGYTGTPSAWDHAARAGQQAWVKIHKGDGRWIGGWVTQGSFATTYPEKPSIYIAQQYIMTEEGNFGPAIPQTGVYVTIGDDDIVIWTKPALSQASGWDTPATVDGGSTNG